jgi:transglutaminase-like putative cysteine protease
MRIFHGRAFPAAVIVVMAFVMPVVSAASGKERQALVVIEANLKAPVEAKNVRLWIPYPMSDKNQDVTNVIINGNYSFMGVYRDPQFGSNELYAEWNGPVQERKLSFSFNVKRKELVTKNFLQKEMPFSPDEFKAYLGPTSLGQTAGIVKEYALKITKGKKTVLAKARAVYDWIVDNMRRDPDTKGCGFGEVEKLLGTLGGKCADIQSVYVALARASGVPAREVFGIRIPRGKEGDMTKAQHCWAEFYLPGKGWVVVDPADVRKMILEQNLSIEQAKPYREYYFGAVDESMVAFGMGRDIILNPPQSASALNYFVYPYAEADGKPLNEDLYGFNIGYKITFREL